MDRRDFLLKSAAQTAALSVMAMSGCWSPVSYLGSPSGKKGKTLVALKPGNSGISKLRIYDWDTGHSKDVDVPLDLIHSVVQDRVNPDIVYVFEIFGSCVRMDLSDNSCLKSDHRKSPDDLYNGHGAQTSSSEFLACTEIPNNRSILTLRSAKTLQKVATAPEECGNCHQVVSLPKSNLVACGNLRGLDRVSQTGGITFYDYEKRKVANRIEFPFPVLHMLPVSSTEVIGLTLLTQWHGTARPNALTHARDSKENIRVFSEGQTFVPGPLYYAKTDGTSKTLWDPDHKDLFMDNFGLAGISPGTFLSGHHWSGKVIFWKDYKIAKVFSVPSAKNIAASADGSEFMAISGETLKFFSLETYEEIQPKSTFPPVVTLASYRTI